MYNKSTNKSLKRNIIRKTKRNDMISNMRGVILSHVRVSDIQPSITHKTFIPDVPKLTRPNIP